LRDSGAEIVVGSLESYGDIENAMKGVVRAYFCPPLEPGTLRRASLFAAAAREAKLEAVVQLSQWVADRSPRAPWARKMAHQPVLSWLPDVGVIAVQPGWFADNYFAVIRQAAQFGLLGLPLGQGLNAPPSNEDIACVIVACLVNLHRMSARPIGRPGRACFRHPKLPRRWAARWAGTSDIRTCRCRCF
jgi:uncharacterized protein YbjT (DUF2867 family)